jgi:hypothetical protein
MVVVLAVWICVVWWSGRRSIRVRKGGARSNKPCFRRQVVNINISLYCFLSFFVVMQRCHSMPRSASTYGIKKLHSCCTRCWRYAHYSPTEIPFAFAQHVFFALVLDRTMQVRFRMSKKATSTPNGTSRVTSRNGFSSAAKLTARRTK